MKKTLLYLYLMFLVLFTINVMNQPDPEEIVVPDLQLLTNGKSKYVLPKTPIFSVQNNTKNLITIDNCTHLEIRRQGALRPLSDELCQQVPIEPETIEAIL